MAARRIRARLTRDSPYEPWRERPRLQPDPGQRHAELAEEADQSLRLARHLGLADDPARPVDHADAASFQGDVDPGIVLHGCPSMMPGADPLGPRALITSRDSRPASLSSVGPLPHLVGRRRRLDRKSVV